MSAIKTYNLNKKYGSREIVRDVSIDVREGEIYGLIGRNGAGKTTLIRLITGLAFPDSGEIEINGERSAEGLTRMRRDIGSIIDQPSFIPHISALGNMKASAMALGYRGEEEKLRGLLRYVGLNDGDNLRVKNYSLGMKQRLAIAMALIDDPKILILDEPVNGLDPTGIYEVRELIKKLNSEMGATILISSHLLNELGKVANAYGVMENGKLSREVRGSELEELSRPFIKVVVGDLRRAVNVLADNFKPHEFEILPFNTIAIYDFSRGIGATAALFNEAGVPVMSIAQQEGDLESTFIAMMGGGR